MERRILIAGNKASERDESYFRALLLSYDVEGSFNLDYERIGSGKKGRARITISGPANYSHIDSALCNQGFRIIAARTRKYPTLEGISGGQE
jgi:hypothetical protein